MSEHITHRPETTGWVGWAVFASFMMMLTGVFQFIFGLTAIVNDQYFAVTRDQLLLFDLTAWGWIHLIIGALVFFAGISVMSGGLFGRTIGVILAFLSAVASIASLSVYPVWSVIVITIDVLVIYALTAHGGELKE